MKIRREKRREGESGMNTIWGGFKKNYRIETK